jgi:hypothetical protein
LEPAPEKNVRVSFELSLKNVMISFEHTPKKNVVGIGSKPTPKEKKVLGEVLNYPQRKKRY